MCAYSFLIACWKQFVVMVCYYDCSYHVWGECSTFVFVHLQGSEGIGMIEVEGQEVETEAVTTATDYATSIAMATDYATSVTQATDYATSVTMTTDYAGSVTMTTDLSNVQTTNDINTGITAATDMLA